MSNILFECWVPGTPVPKKEYQANRFGGNMADKDGRLKAWKDLLAIFIQSAWYDSDQDIFPLDQPLELYLYFCFEASKKVRKKLTERSALFMVKDTQPDFDNLAKPVCDALERCGVVVRDSRFATAIVRKLWTVGEAGVQIYICKPEHTYMQSITIS